MTAKRKIATAEFTRAAVALITHHGYGVSAAARNLGLHATMLRKWKRPLAQRAGLSRPRSSASGAGSTASAAARK